MPEYPPQQPAGDYPPQQQPPAYSPPAPQPGYPPQQPGYPPQQPGYPPQQPGYPPQAAYPPQGYPPHQPGYPQGPAVTQQSTSNVVVVNTQPAATVVTRTVKRTGDHYLTLSIVLTFCCFFCGTWYSLFCTIPAIFVAVAARDAEARGDDEGARSKGRVALILNIIAMVWWIVALVIIIGAAAGVNASASSSGYYSTRYTSYRYS